MINIYIVYKLDPLASTRDKSFTIQNALFGAMQITKDATDARSILIFGADMSFSVHATNRANHIYLMGTGLTQSINDTTIYAEKNFYRKFTDFAL